MNLAFRPVPALLLLAAVLPAQAGVSGAGHARTRELAALGRLPTPADVAIADIINYHRHRLPLPRAGEAVALDLRFGAATVAPGELAVLQIGYTTAPADDRRDLPPLNLALVIDCSGSMADAGKMDQVQRGLLAMCERLRASDRVALIAYADEAAVREPSRPVGDGDWLRERIRALTPGGSTNLHGGLMLGLRQAREHRLTEGSNRVILLTDGIANRGETDPEAILRDARRFTADGIDLSTIGVGQDLNTALLDRLARGGRGLFHFVADAQEARKVFVDELQSLVAPAARGVRLQLELPAELELVRVFGHTPRGRDGDDDAAMALELPDLGRGITAVVLATVRCRGEVAGPLTARARLQYRDADRGELRSQGASATVRVGARERSDQRGEFLADAEVRRNFAIATLAQALRDMAQAAQDQRWSEADRVLRRALGQTRAWLPSGDDADVERVRAMAEGHLRTLQGHLERFGDH